MAGMPRTDKCFQITSSICGFASICRYVGNGNKWRAWVETKNNTTAAISHASTRIWKLVNAVLACLMWQIYFGDFVPFLLFDLLVPSIGNPTQSESLFFFVKPTGFCGIDSQDHALGDDCEPEPKQRTQR